MSNLTRQEARKIEKLLGISSGYVLNFSNRTFEEFVQDHTGRNIYDTKYDLASGSKANRLRAFWNQEPNHQVAKLLTALLDHGSEIGAFKTDEDQLLAACRQTTIRLSQDTPVPDIDALTPNADERDFEAVAKQAQEAIQRNEPETGLDRLHTFVIKYVRTLCDQRQIPGTRDKPLHSLFGEYVKSLRTRGHIESVMTERILKSSISTLEAFNEVRNQQSLAHDNPILNHDESLLIYNHVTSAIRFIRTVESRAKLKDRKNATSSASLDDLPF